MNERNTLLDEISDLLGTLESQYPEIYHFLDENPITLPIKTHPEVGKKAMEEYLQSLRTLLQHHLKTLKNKSNEKEKV
ncbi:hypothetical protein GTQ34_05240 [Muricauda sp. JGD-17]|uniref:Uncharacterized protein n=1 Tax=Flagellimonas ochracea TaxID=2696472 RepID=A0A964TAK1_9FLAO|nr:hypothetical protein [Allomuricauda ochracea]NAY91317.1 hypothetical protein [Allomuricauda ochracea]